jgi:predicted ATPase
VLELLTEQASAKTLAEHTHLPGGLPDAVFYLETFFATKFRYLGPLRDEPRAIYPYPTKLDPVDLGRRGEYTAAAYHAYADVLVRHVEYKELVEYGPVASERTATLKAAVDEWLRYLGVAEHLVSKEDKYGHVLGVGTVRGTGGSDWEMIHVGTGVSQVLPILVLGLLAQSDSTLVIEHPELHLHPGAQARLADFFLFLALTGRQIIVETHSEYILHRLRRRIVGPEGEALRSEIGILFAGVENGATSFREVSINEYGAIEEWPEGFFDAAAVETEGILRAAIEKETGRRS